MLPAKLSLQPVESSGRAQVHQQIDLLLSCLMIVLCLPSCCTRLCVRVWWFDRVCQTPNPHQNPTWGWPQVPWVGQPQLGLTDAVIRPSHVVCRCWQEQEEEIIDDCTAMVIYLEPAAAPNTTTGANLTSSNKPYNATPMVQSGGAAGSAAGHAGYNINAPVGLTPSAAAKDLANKLGSGLRLKGGVAATVDSSRGVGRGGIHAGALGYKRS